MYSKLIIVLATLCLANASVVIKVFDDDPDIGVKSPDKDCNPTACDQLCRRLKFPGGACVNGRCKCDNFRNENEAMSEISPSDFEALSSLGDELENGFLANYCSSFAACDRLCRRLKWPGGACVYGRCKCNTVPISEDADLELSPSDLEGFSAIEDEPLSEAEEVERSSCSLSACEQYCHRLKLPGGTCVKGRCKCDKFLREQDELENEYSANDCNPTACDQLCRRLKFPGGACVNGRCKCDNFRSSEDAVLKLSPSDLEAFSSIEDEPLSEAEEVERSSCSLSACEQYCHRLKLPGGTCVNGRCKCDKFLREQVELENEYSANDCNPTACDQLCRRLKFPGGACVNGRCKCDNFRSSEDAVLELSPSDLESFSSIEDEPLSEAEEVERSSCSLSACEQYCHRLKLPGGTCVNGRCKCDKFLSDQVEIFTPAVPEVTPAKLTADSCDLRSCEFICRTMKLARGACIAGRCQCFLPAGLVDANSSPVLEPPKNQSHGKCRQGLCNLICHKLKYDSGECVENKCKCSKNGGSEKVNTTLFLEPAKNQTHKCRQGLCDLVCRKLKFKRGECVDNKCKCYRDGAKTDNDMPVSKFSEDLTKVKCTKRVCDRMCRSLDYKGGNCKNGKCWCYGRPKKPARLMLEDTENEEQERINQDVSLEEDDNDVTLAERAKVKCTKGVCNRMCRSLDYKGGNCKGGKCWCYGPPKKPARSIVEDATSEEEKEISLDDATEKAPPMSNALNEEEKEVSQDETTEKAPPMSNVLNKEEKEVSQDETTEKAPPMSNALTEEEKEVSQDETTEKVKPLSHQTRAAHKGTCTKKACKKKCEFFGGPSFCWGVICICL